MADRCVFFDELVQVDRARQRSYVVYEPAGSGLACVDVRLRRGPDWWFARRWVSTRPSPRPLYRLLDRLEALGFRFRVERAPAPGLSPADAASWERRDREVGLSARTFLADLSEDERRLHAELFPEEADLLSRGYDWDARHVYRDGAVIAPDPHGRILETTGGVLYEWVPVVEEMTWRRYPIQRVAGQGTRVVMQ